MNTHTNVATQRLGSPHAYDVASALRAQSASLAAIVAVLGDAAGQAAVAELKRQVEAAAPDEQLVLGSAARVRDMLAEVRFADLAEVEAGADGPRDFAASVNWHGARLDELMSRLAAISSEG
tara:strand:- start:478 stop:843 length:366 start_codon:yes stop_codon:yes gene_type:complete